MLLDKKNKARKQGEIFRWPELAQTLREVAAGGAGLFYNGSVMNKMVADLRRQGAIITQRDFMTYSPRVYQALEVRMSERNMTMFGVRPPGSGALLGFILNIMSGYKDLYPEATRTEQDAALFFHRLIESFKFAYAKRMQMGDEQFDDVKSLVDELTSEEFAKRTRAQIRDDKTFPAAHYGTVHAVADDHGTAHVSVVDQYGNAVAATSSVNL